MHLRRRDAMPGRPQFAEKYKMNASSSGVVLRHPVARPRFDLAFAKDFIAFPAVLVSGLLPSGFFTKCAAILT